MKEATVSMVTDSITGTVTVTMIFERKAPQLVFDAIAEMMRAVAKEFTEKNMDKIMAGIDLNGLANLIAVYASKKLADSQKE